jgi:hypothetical protein
MRWYRPQNAETEEGIPIERCAVKCPIQMLKILTNTLPNKYNQTKDHMCGIVSVANVPALRKQMRTT